MSKALAQVRRQREVLSGRAGEKSEGKLIRASVPDPHYKVPAGHREGSGGADREALALGARGCGLGREGAALPGTISKQHLTQTHPALLSRKGTKCPQCHTHKHSAWSPVGWQLLWHFPLVVQAEMLTEAVCHHRTHTLKGIKCFLSRFFLKKALTSKSYLEKP